MAGNSSMRGRQTVRDMVLSMAAIGVVVAVGYAFLPHDGGDGVHVVDYRSSLASAKRAAPYPLLGPEGLSDKWRATSVEYKQDAKGAATWHLGFVTPSGDYAAIEQSNGNRDQVIADAVSGGQPDGNASVDGKEWERYQGSRYRGLTVQTGSATTVVTGSASYQELSELAQALK
ncbi:DUF4245 domain-containing protein [Kitasatospora sp. NPDC056138]|uniref:DUF4245 domain-containing protein n=1 Tax=Kitasatospora sp. NPDC056138 TaxID=3345724 RepID=UPI0035E11E88